MISIGLFKSFLLFKLANSVLHSIPNEQGQTSAASDLESFALEVLGAYFVVSSLAYLPAQFVSANLDTALYVQPQLLVSRLYLDSILKENLSFFKTKSGCINFHII